MTALTVLSVAISFVQAAPVVEHAVSGPTAPMAQPVTSTGPKRLIIQLEDEPLATYKGGVPGLEGTMAAPGYKLNVNSPAS
jgi:hypothetical protein